MTTPLTLQTNSNSLPLPEQATNGRASQSQEQVPQSQNTDTARQEAQRLQQELDDRVRVLGDRVRGTQYNIERTEREMPGRFNIFAGGVRRGMQQSVDTDRRLLGRLQSERNTQAELQTRINRFMQEGKYEEATAVMQGREQEYRQRIVNTGRQAIQDSQAANKELADADRFLGHVETGLRVAQRGTVIAGAVVATAATGGAGAPLLVTAIAGTTAGTGIGALTNFTEAAGHVAHGNMSAGDAFHRATVQTGQDALTSAQIGISGGVGAAAGRAVIGTTGAQITPALTRVVTSGMVGGSTSGLTGSVLQTGTNIALGNEQRSAGDIVRDISIQTGIGTISGGLGARGQAALNNTIAQGGTNSFARTLLIRSTAEVAAPTALTLGTHYAVHGEINPHQATQDVANSILSSMVGARINQNHLNGRYGNNWRSNLDHEFSTPTFNSVGGSIRGLFVRQTPPALAAGAAGVALTQNTNGTGQPNTQNTQNQPTTSTQTQSPPPRRVQINDQLEQQLGQSYQTAINRGRVEIIVDETLPPGTRAQAEVIEQNGARTQRIRVSRDLAEGLQNGNGSARRVLSEEIDHLNQSMIDPRRNGSIISEQEYLARRAFQEITAESSSSSRLGGPRRGNILRQMRQKMDTSDFDGAMALAVRNGVTDADVAIFRQDYEANINSGGRNLVQRSRSTSVAEEIQELISEAQTVGDIRTARELADLDGVGRDVVNESARQRIRQRIEGDNFYDFEKVRNARALVQEVGMSPEAYTQMVRDRIIAEVDRSRGLTNLPQEIRDLVRDFRLQGAVDEHCQSNGYDRWSRRLTTTEEETLAPRLEREAAENQLAGRGMIIDKQVSDEFGGLVHGQDAWHVRGSNKYWVWDNTGHANGSGNGPTYKRFVKRGNSFEREGTYDSNFNRIRD